MPAIDLSQPSEQQARWSLFIGIVIWFLHLNILNSLISVSCKWGRLNFPVAGITGQQFFTTIISVITILLMLFLIYLPWRHWRSFQTEKPITNPELLHDTDHYARPLLAFIAMLLNSFFVLYIIATLVPVFSLEVCGHA